jgi:FlaA1/EpsC-like NDP-sugar epimerase
MNPIGRARLLRDVSDGELLGRDPVKLSELEVRNSIYGQSLLVTGAAGSIGSELCRQIARFQPAAIIGVDIAESPLFEIEQEMRATFPHIRFHPVIGNIQNRERLDDIFYHYHPSACYHAAAYKHVPLMEQHVLEAIENNVIGTANLALAAVAHEVRDFVLISSDKAVRPTSIMGATKRMAEMLLQGLRNDRTRCIAVRFGNVLGSTGSVLTIFRRQLASGGPITITHPDMRRYFMTIPEACQLVLQASILAGQGPICVLDMGEPIRIVDLAHRLIRLSGLEPEKDIRIEFTGVRPGEKLYEELSSLFEDTVPTPNPYVRIVVGERSAHADFLAQIQALHAICQHRDAGRALEAIRIMVPDYTPSTELLARIAANSNRHR